MGDRPPRSRVDPTAVPAGRDRAGRRSSLVAVLIVHCLAYLPALAVLAFYGSTGQGDGLVARLAALSLVVNLTVALRRCFVTLRGQVAEGGASPPDSSTDSLWDELALVGEG